MKHDIKRNFTPVPNQLIDSILNRLKSIDVVILLIIIRMTIGWKKESDDISYSMFMNISGIASQTTISDSIARLENEKLIIVTKHPKRTSNYKLGPALNLHLNSDINQIAVEKGVNLVHKMENSKKWTSSSSKNGQESIKTAPENGETKDNQSIKKATTRADDVVRFFNDSGINLELTVAYSNELATFLNTANLDLMYFSWIYEYVINKANIDSVGAYFRTIYPLKAYITEYQRIENKSEPVKIEIVCPVCEKKSSSNATCTSCGVHIYDISEVGIRREKAIQKLSVEKKEEYDKAILAAMFECKGRPTYTQREKEIKLRFGIPLD